jgi:hypothetical protein
MKQSSIEWLINQLTEVDNGCINKTFLQMNNTLSTHIMKEIFETAKAMHEDEMKKFGIKCQMAMYNSDQVWSVEDVWDKEFNKQQDETEQY